MKNNKVLLLLALLALAINTDAQTGNVGIGTTTPSPYLFGTNGLSIFGASPGLSLANNSKSWLLYGRPSDNSFRLFEGGVNLDRITVLPGGNVGIGTNNPGAPLDVIGGMQVRDAAPLTGSMSMVRGTAQYTGYIEWNRPSGLRTAYMGFDQDNNLGLHLENGSNFYVESGNVGIGTTTPDANAKLDVSGRTRTTNFRMPTGAAVGHVLTCNNTNGEGVWQAPVGYAIENVSATSFSVATTYAPSVSYTIPANGTYRVDYEIYFNYSSPVDNSSGFIVEIKNGTNVIRQITINPIRISSGGSLLYDVTDIRSVKIQTSAAVSDVISVLITRGVIGSVVHLRSSLMVTRVN